MNFQKKQQSLLKTQQFNTATNSKHRLNAIGISTNYKNIFSIIDIKIKYHSKMLTIVVASKKSEILSNPKYVWTFHTCCFGFCSNTKPTYWKGMFHVSCVDNSFSHARQSSQQKNIVFGTVSSDFCELVFNAEEKIIIVSLIVTERFNSKFKRHSALQNFSSRCFALYQVVAMFIQYSWNNGLVDAPCYNSFRISL